MLTITFSYPAIIKNKGTARFHKFIKYPGTSAVSVCPQPNQQTPSSFCRRGYASAESLDRPTSLPGCSCLSAYMHVPSPEAPTSPSDQNVDSVCLNSYAKSCHKRCLCLRSTHCTLHYSWSHLRAALSYPSVHWGWGGWGGWGVGYL